MQYNKKKIYNTTTVGRGSHYFDDNEAYLAGRSKSNERKFVIQCVMDEYEESNSNIRARHPKLFKDDTYEFEASQDLLMCMPFDFIDGLKDKKWTHIDQNWLARLMRHPKKAQSSNIKQIRFMAHWKA